MSRPNCARCIHIVPPCLYFAPRGVPASKLGEVVLGLDEFEALRLADLEGHYQQVAAERMKVSRQTFARIVTSARRKVAEALVGGKALRLEGGNIVIGASHLAKCSECIEDCEAKQLPCNLPDCPTCVARILLSVPDPSSTDGPPDHKEQ